MSIGKLVEKYQEKIKTTQAHLDRERERRTSDVGFLAGSLSAYENILTDLLALPIPSDEHTVWDIYIYDSLLGEEDEFPFRPVLLGLSLQIALREAERRAHELCPEGFYWNIHPGSGRGVGQIKGKKSKHLRADVLLRGVKLHVT